jgi:hypothetical protein
MYKADYWVNIPKLSHVHYICVLAIYYIDVK